LTEATPDDCGEYILVPDEGYSSKVIRVECSMEDAAYWASLVGVQVRITGEDLEADSGCGVDGSGGPYFCAYFRTVSAETHSWSAVKALYGTR